MMLTAPMAWAGDDLESGFRNPDQTCRIMPTPETATIRHLHPPQSDPLKPGASRTYGDPVIPYSFKRSNTNG